MEWLDGDGCTLIISSPAGELMHVSLEQLAVTARFGSDEDGTWLRFSYTPTVYPEDGDEPEPAERRYVILRADTGKIITDPRRPFYAELVNDRAG